jgi:hypothetical protein
VDKSHVAESFWNSAAFALMRAEELQTYKTSLLHDVVQS